MPRSEQDPLRAGRELDVDAVLDGRMPAEQLATLTRFRGLTTLNLRLQPGLRDEDLAMLHGMTQLKRLSLASSQVTTEGRERLHAALPECSISCETW